jgi:hypothetical protein
MGRPLAAQCHCCSLVIYGEDAGERWNTRYIPAGYRLMPDLLSKEMMEGKTLSECLLLQEQYSELLEKCGEVNE